MEKPYFSMLEVQRSFAGWLVVLLIMLCTFVASSQTPEPRNLSVAGLTQTTALISWECDPSPNHGDGDLLHYDYVISTNQLSTTLNNNEFAAMTEGVAGVVAVGRAIEMETNQLVFDNLLAGTMYYMLIRQNAEDAYDGTSSWVAISFNTLCEGSVLPIALQTFDAGSMPACWVGAGTSAPVLQSAYRYGDSGNALKLESTSENYSYLFSPVIQGRSSASEIVFKLYAAGSTYQRFSVGVADASDIMSYIPVIQDSIAPGEWRDVSVVDVTGFYDGNYVWVIYAEAGVPAVFYVDNIEIRDKPTCIRPQLLNVTDITATSATFAWTPQGAETAWNLELTAEGLETPIVIPVTANPFIYEGLRESTSYTVRVQADCGDVDGVSDWSTSIVFKTLQMPLPLPYECDFESGVSWNLINGNSVNAWTIGSAVNNGGSKALYISDNAGTSNSYVNTTETNVWATRLLEVTEEGDYIFRFDWKANGESSYDYLAAVLVPADVSLEAGSSAGLSFGSYGVTIPDRWISLSGTTRLNKSETWQTCVSEQHLLPGQYNLAFFWKNDNSGGTNPPAAVDNVSITKVLCPKPTLPTFSGLSANSVTLIFADQRAYNVKMFTTQSAEPATDGTAVFTQENVSSDCVISGLEENTMYYAYIQAICDESDSEWVGPLQITTLCASLTEDELPYENGFEEETGDFPGCWTLIYTEDDSYPRVESGSSGAFEGSKYLYSSYYVGGYYEDPIAFKAMFALPGMAEDVDMTGLSLHFYMKGAGADIVVGIMTDPSDKNTFTEVETVVGTSQYQEYLVNLTSYTGDGKYIALKYDSVFASVYIDKMRIIPTPTCLKPISFEIKDIFSTEARIEVKDVDHTKTVDVEYGIQGFVQGSGTMVQIQPGDSLITLTGLTPQTSYDIYVRNNCGSGDVSEWLLKQSFTTLCTAFSLTAEEPFVEDFESYNANDVNKALGGCWQQLSVNKTWELTTQKTSSSYELMPRSGSYAAFLSYSADAWMYRMVHLEPGNYQMSCYAVQDKAEGYTISFGIGESISTINEFYSQEIGNGEYQQVRAEFHIATAGDYVIGLHGTSEFEPNAMLVDDIKLMAVNCLSPSAPVVSEYSDVTAKVTWNSTEAASYNLKVFATPPADVETATPVYSKTGIVAVDGHLYDWITGLSPKTVYYVYVQSVCDDGGVSEWSNPVSFTTECAAVVLSEELPYVDGFEEDSQLDCWNISVQEEGGFNTTTTVQHSGSTAIYAYKTSAKSPQFNFADGANLSNFQLSGFAYATADNQSFIVNVQKDRENVISVREVELPVKNEWQEFIISLAPLAGLGEEVENYKYIEFNFTGEERIYLDDLRLEVIPTCPKPSGITFSDITDASALMNWISNGSETQWRIVITEEGSEEAVVNEVTNQRPYSITGLQSNTTYNVELTAVCVADEDESQQVAATFKTICGMYSLPFVENFNTLTTGIPDCWDNTEGTTTSASYKWSYSNKGYEGACVRFDSYYNTNGNTNFLKTPVIALSEDARISFAYKNLMDEYDTGAEFHVVLFEADGTTRIDTIASNLQSNVWKDTTISLSDYTGQNVVVKFVGICHSDSEYDYWDGGYYYYGDYLYLDNVVIEAIPSCEKPQNVTVSEKTTTGATINVTDNVHSAWEYVCVASGSDVSTATPVAMMSNATTVTGLEANTIYDLYVRAVCSEEDKSAWFGPVIFSTMALPVSLPYACDFEGTEAWTLLNGIAVNAWTIGSAVNNGGSKSLYISNDGGVNNMYTMDNAISHVWAIKPFEVTEESAYAVSFDWRATGESSFDYLLAFIVPASVDIIEGDANGVEFASGTTTIPEEWISLSGTDRLNLSGEWQKCYSEIDLAVGTYQLVFYWRNDHSGGANPPAAVDNVSISVLTCSAPVGLTVDNIEETQAQLIFATEGTYNVKVFETLPNDVDAAVAVVEQENVTGTSCTITGLQPGTTYYVYTQAVCEDAVSMWAEPVSVTTLCGAESLPFVENFDDWEAISSCWTNEHTAGTSTSLWLVSTTNAYSGKAAYLGYQPSGNKVVLSTPRLEVEAGKTYRVTYYMYHHNYNYYDDYMNVYCSATALPNASSALIGTSYSYVGTNIPYLGTASGIYKHEHQWTQNADDTVYIAFEMVWNNGVATAIDEIVVEEVPSCECPVSVKVSNVTASSVDIHINDPFGTAWEVVVGQKGFNPNDESFNISPLESSVGTVVGIFEPNVEMELYVRTDCGEEDGKSRWYGPVMFKFVDWSTISGEGIGLGSEGDYPWEIFNDAGTSKAQSTNTGVHNTTSDLTASFVLAEGERATLSFNYYASSEEDSYGYLNDYLMMFVDPEEGFGNYDYDYSFGKKGGEAGERGTYSLSFEEPGVHTVIWRYYKNYSLSEGEDLAQIWNVTLNRTRFYEPEKLKVNDVTESSATLTWISSLDATGHQVRVMNVGVDTVYIDNLTESTALLSSLNPNTEYKVDVRSTKGTAVGDTTAWSTPLIFRTPMIPISAADLPYNQDWENMVENGNWALINGTPANKWIINNADTTAAVEGSALYVSNNDVANQYSVNASTSIYAYRSFSLEADAYSIAFDWKANGEEAYDYLRAFLVPADVMLNAGEYIGSSSSVPESWIALTDCLYGTTEWQSVLETVILEKAGCYNLVFLWTNDGGGGEQSPAAIDNVVFDAVSCVAVFNLRVLDRGTDFIEVTWDSPQSDAFEAVCVPAGTDISTVDEATFQSFSKDTARFEGLTENASYDIYVRSTCGDTHSYWMSLKDVIALAEYASLPYTCDFETSESLAWTLINGNKVNKWHIGTAINNGGSSALYISNNNGISHAYNNTNESDVYAIRKIRLTESGLCTIAFSWICNGEDTFDYLRAYLAPGDAVINAGTEAATSDWIALGGQNDGATSWRDYTIELELEAGDYQLVFYWTNDGSGGSNPPAAIDNVSFTMLSCMYPTKLNVDGITDNSARVFWTGNAGIGYEVKVDESYEVGGMENPFFSATSADTTIVVTDLLANAEYYVAVRSICAEGDTSQWSTYSFVTECSPVELPFREPFDTDPQNNCWKSYSGLFTETVEEGALSVYSNWYYSSESYKNMDKHMRLNIYGASRKDWLISPSIFVGNDFTGASLRFDLSLNAYSSTATLEPGAQPDDKFIVAISRDNGRTWSRSNGRIWDNAGSEYVYDNISAEGETVVLNLSDYAESGDTIRVAFYGESTVTGGDNNLRIDNVLIGNVETVELFDSICAGSSYSDNGFTIMADELTPGMHHQFSRLEMSVVEGATDKIYNLNLYVYPDANVIVYDTVCAGTPYTEYGFNIDNPTTRTYYGSTGLVTSYGCDSTVILHLFVPETQFQESVAICEGESYEFGGQTLTESGTYTHTFAGMYCDSVVTLDLVVLPSETEESLTICHGDSVLFGDEWRKTSGDYTATFENILGCDSTVTLHLTVRDELRYDYSGILCSGGVYSDENFANLTEGGDHVVTLTSATGCDSIVTLHLTEKTIAPSFIDEEICDGESYTFGDASYNTTGEYPYTFTSVDGCDSLVTLRLTVLPVSESEMTLELTTSELPYELKHNGETIYVVEEGTEPGTSWPEITIENGAANGCDSIINLTLTVKLGDALHLTDYEELEFWPNPIERGGKVVISADFSPAERTNLKIEVYNSIGQCVATHRPTGESLYVEDFHVSGMYLVKVTTGTGRLYVGHVIVK